MKPVARRTFLVCAAALMAPGIARAQASANAPRIGFLGASGAANLGPYVAAFREGLRDLGYVERRNITVDYRFAEGRHERLPALAAELVALGPRVIVTEGSVSAHAARNVSGSVPIVMAQAGDPIAAGLIQSLARPGGNITGVATLSLALVGKQIELLKDMVPGLQRVAVLWNPNHAAHPAALPAIEKATRSLECELSLVPARNPAELEKALADAAAKRPHALVAISEPAYDRHQQQIANFALQNRLPSAYTKDYAQHGGLMSYGAYYPSLFRRSAVYVDRILKGAKPAELPVEQPTRFELIINRTTARALGLGISRDFLARVDRVVD